MRSEIIRSLDLWQSNANIIVPAVTNDKGARYIIARITADGANYEIPNNSQVLLSVLKPDGTETSTSGTFQVGTVTVPLTNQTLAVPGLCDAAIIIINGGAKLSTTPFKLLVYDEVISDTTLTSTDEYNALVAALSAVASYENIGRNYPGSTHGEIFNEYGTGENANTAEGAYSSTFGRRNINKGRYTVLTGLGNTNYARQSVIGGSNNVNGDADNPDAEGISNNCAIFGQNNINKGFASLIGGRWNFNEYDSVLMCGRNLIATTEFQRITGKYNSQVSNALDIVGNGTSDNDRSNAYVLYEDGSARFSGTVRASAPVSFADLTTKEYVDNTARNKANIDNAYLGLSAEAQAFGVAVGALSRSENNGIAIGHWAEATANNSVQIGEGTNEEENSVHIFDKKVYDISTGKIPNDIINIDNELSDTSENSIQNKVITKILNTLPREETISADYVKFPLATDEPVIENYRVRSGSLGLVNGTEYTLTITYDDDTQEVVTETAEPLDEEMPNIVGVQYTYVAVFDNCDFDSDFNPRESDNVTYSIPDDVKELRLSGGNLHSEVTAIHKLDNKFLNPDNEVTENGKSIVSGKAVYNAINEMRSEHIDASRIDNLLIDWNNIANGSIKRNHISDGAIGTKQIYDNTVTADKIANNDLDRHQFQKPVLSATETVSNPVSGIQVFVDAISKAVIFGSIQISNAATEAKTLILEQYLGSWERIAQLSINFEPNTTYYFSANIDVLTEYYANCDLAISDSRDGTCIAYVHPPLINTANNINKIIGTIRLRFADASEFAEGTTMSVLKINERW